MTFIYKASYDMLINYRGDSMNRLERLIHRIENPVTMSKEDAWDTVKGYWDDVVGTYWADVDEDLAEEIGVTPTALSELLEVHRHTSDYANIGGNSGVRGYDHGKDWFVVMFSDGSRYLYTLKSTDRETLDYMLQLARTGKGLNSYINKGVGSNYAGRNYKGTITIKPGMEQFNPGGFRRLSLLQAFRNTMTYNTVSNEGIWDTLKRLFTVAPKDEDKPKPSPPPEHVLETAQRIEQSPPRQLIEVTSTSPIFQKNGLYNPSWIKQLEGDIKQYMKIVKDMALYDRKLKTWHDKWEPKIDEFMGDADRSEEFAATIKAWVAEQPKPWLDVFNNGYEFLGYGKNNWADKDYGFRKSKMPQSSSVIIPTQDETQTKQVIKLITQLGNWLVYALEISDKFTYTQYDLTDAPFRGYYRDDAVVAELNKLRYHSDAAISPYNHFNVIEDRIESILATIVNYIKDASSNSVGNEVFMHVALKRYKNQIQLAGRDGLDPVAIQLMSVGLESMGIGSKVALESHDAKEAVNETDMLKTMIDGALTGSNESFWSSIKDFFAGRPKKVHLSGRDANLISKLNSTINDRVWLSRQKYTLGEVSYKAIPGFNVNSAAQMVRQYTNVTHQAAQFNQREMDKVADRLRAVPELFKLYATRDLMDLSPIQTVLNDLNPYAIRLNINLREPEISFGPPEPQTGPALTKIEVKQFSSLVADVFNAQVAFEKSTRISTSIDWKSQVTFRYQHKPGGEAVLAQLARVETVYNDLIVKINRELRQRITTHSAWIGAENLANSLVNYISRSISNVSSNEAFVEKSLDE